MTLAQYAIARHKLQLEQLQERRPLRKPEQDRLKLLRAIVAEYDAKDRAALDIRKTVQSGT